MGTHGFTYRTALVGAAVAALLVGATSVGAQAGPSAAAPGSGATEDRGASYWTPARRAAAQPRDLVVDERGLGYLKQANGTLEPYGHSIAASSTPVRATAPAGSERPQARPPSNGDGAAPAVTDVSPTGDALIGADHEFRATVTDADGIKSVDFVISNGQSFPANRIGTSDVYGIDFTGFTDGGWSWTIVARDNSKRGGATTTDGPHDFWVDTGGTTPPTTEPPPTTPPPTDPPAGTCNNGTDPIVNDPWTCGGTVQTAAGRIFFEMPANRRGNRWSGYVCSGTAVDDTTAGTSIILTAAHCVYDDVAKTFARNVLFIPNQAGTTGAGTDRDCANDPLGCWEPTHGVVDVDWTMRTFPDNIPWDYAYYVVPDGGANGSLADAAGTLPIDFTTADVQIGAHTHALGYSYSDDPNFMYCAEGLATESTYGDYWLPSCGLSGGSSGGPWIQPMDVATGSGSIISVNSWGYTGLPGMGGPPLTTTAECVFTAAQNDDLTQARGVVATCP